MLQPGYKTQGNIKNETSAHSTVQSRVVWIYNLNWNVNLYANKDWTFQPFTWVSLSPRFSALSIIDNKVTNKGEMEHKVLTWILHVDY